MRIFAADALIAASLLPFFIATAYQKALTNAGFNTWIQPPNANDLALLPFQMLGSGGGFALLCGLCVFAAARLRREPLVGFIALVCVLVTALPLIASLWRPIFFGKYVIFVIYPFVICFVALTAARLGECVANLGLDSRRGLGRNFGSDVGANLGVGENNAPQDSGGIFGSGAANPGLNLANPSNPLANLAANRSANPAARFCEKLVANPAANLCVKICVFVAVFCVFAPGLFDRSVSPIGQGSDYRARLEFIAADSRRYENAYIVEAALDFKKSGRTYEIYGLKPAAKLVPNIAGIESGAVYLDMYFYDFAEVRAALAAMGAKIYKIPLGIRSNYKLEMEENFLYKAVLE